MRRRPRAADRLCRAWWLTSSSVHIDACAKGEQTKFCIMQSAKVYMRGNMTTSRLTMGLQNGIRTVVVECTDVGDFK